MGESAMKLGPRELDRAQHRIASGKQHPKKHGHSAEHATRRVGGGGGAALIAT